MNKQVLKAIVITSIILIIHVMLCAFLIYCNAKVYMGFLGENGSSTMVSFGIPLLIIIFSKLWEEPSKAIQDSEQDSERKSRCPKWLKTLWKWSGSIAKGIIFGLLAIGCVYFACKKILSNPFLYGNYICGVILLAGLIACLISRKWDNMGKGYIFCSLWTLIGDGLLSCVLVVMLIGLQPINYSQAYTIASESGLTAPEFLNHGETGSMSSYFGQWGSDLSGIELSVYLKNRMNIRPLDIQENEGTLGYYFFAGEKNGEPWGIAISGKTGRIVKESAIENPFL